MAAVEDSIVLCFSLFPDLIKIYFLGSILLLGLLYIICLYVKIYKYWYKVESPFEDGAWDEARTIVMENLRKIGRFWHGYEHNGLEKVPSVGPAILVFYHGGAPIDFLYVKASIFLEKHRLMRFVSDRSLFQLPGCELGLHVLGYIPGTYEECVEILKAGHLLGIAPGGSEEAQFGDPYKVNWKGRVGYARLALETKMPVIPCFTQNIREAFNTVGLPKRWLLPLYKKTRIPFVPPCGGLPVKLRTYIGDPIAYDPKLTAEELSEKLRH